MSQSTLSTMEENCDVFKSRYSSYGGAKFGEESPDDTTLQKYDSYGSDETPSPSSEEEDLSCDSSSHENNFFFNSIHDMTGVLNSLGIDQNSEQKSLYEEIFDSICTQQTVISPCPPPLRNANSYKSAFQNLQNLSLLENGSNAPKNQETQMPNFDTNLDANQSEILNLSSNLAKITNFEPISSQLLNLRSIDENKQEMLKLGSQLAKTTNYEPKLLNFCTNSHQMSNFDLIGSQMLNSNYAQSPNITPISSPMFMSNDTVFNFGSNNGSMVDYGSKTGHFAPNSTPVFDYAPNNFGNSTQFDNYFFNEEQAGPSRPFFTRPGSLATPFIAPIQNLPNFGQNNPISPPISASELLLKMSKAKNYVIYEGSAGAEVPSGFFSFYLESKCGEIDFDICQFMVKVECPSGFRAKISYAKDGSRRSRYLVLFEVVELGLYRISVTLAAVETAHVHGSILSILVDERAFMRSRQQEYESPLNHDLEQKSFLPLEMSQIAKIWGVASNINSTFVFAADRDAHEILKFSTEGGKLSLIHKFSPPSFLIGSDTFFRPTGIALDTTNNRVLVTDKETHAVFIFSTNGRYISRFGSKGSGVGEFLYPWGIAVSPNGSLIAVADSRNHRVQLFNQSGIFLNKFELSVTSPTQYKHFFDTPRGIAFNNSGTRLYVTDFQIQNVFAFKLDLLDCRSMCPYGRIQRPQGLVMNPEGNLLICDSRTNCIRCINPHGTLLYSITDLSGLPLDSPQDVAITAGGRLCISDYSGSRISLF